MAYIGQGIKQGTFKVLDTSGNTYNGSNTTFSLGTQVGSAAQLLVSHDGVIQLPGTDYTLASGGASITFTTAPASGASIFIVEISGAVGGTVTPSDNSVGITQLNVSDGSNGQALTTNGSGTLSFSTISTGLTGIDDQSSSNDDQLTITDTAVVINEDSDDVDFRVESNGNANMLHVSGGNDIVGIGNEGDLGNGLHIKIADTSAGVSNDADEFVIEGSTNIGMTFATANDSVCSINFSDPQDNDIGQFTYDHNNNRMLFVTNAVERLRIASDGETSINDGHVDIGSTTALKVKGGSGAPTCIFTHKATSGSEAIAHFRDGDNETCGSITINAANNTTAFNTSSDYRLKENLSSISDGITRLKQFKPYRFNWKSNSSGDKVDGFLAHEVSNLVPEAVYGEKDGEEMQGIDQSKLVPLLTAALQEAIAEIESLKSRVTTLEG